MVFKTNSYFVEGTVGHDRTDRERDDEWLNPGAAGNDDVDTMPPTSTLDIHFWPAAKRCRPMVIFGILFPLPVQFVKKSGFESLEP